MLKKMPVKEIGCIRLAVALAAFARTSPPWRHGHGAAAAGDPARTLCENYCFQPAGEGAVAIGVAKSGQGLQTGTISPEKGSLPVGHGEMRVVGHEEAEFLDNRRRAGTVSRVEQTRQRDISCAEAVFVIRPVPPVTRLDGGAEISKAALIPAIRPGGPSVMGGKDLDPDWSHRVHPVGRAERLRGHVIGPNSSTRNVKTRPASARFSHCDGGDQLYFEIAIAENGCISGSPSEEY